MRSLLLATVAVFLAVGAHAQNSNGAVSPQPESGPGPYLGSDTLSAAVQQQVSNANLSSATATAAGTVTARTLSARLADRLNVKDFGAKGDGVTDDSSAFSAAITAMMSKVASGSYPCVYMPAGTYLIKGTTLPLMVGAGCILGDSELHTIVKIDPAYSGDLFSFSEAWAFANFPYNGNTPTLGGSLGGPQLSNFSIVGDRSTTNTQNAIMFYDRDMFLQMSDVEVRYVKGRALAFGLTKNQPQAFIQESRITRTRFLNDGAAGIPVVEFNAAGSAGQEGSGEVNVDVMDIYANYGPGLVIRNASGTAFPEMRFTKLRIEGLENNPTGIQADLLTIGDPVLTGIVNGLTFKQTSLLDPYAGYAAVRTTAPSSASQPYDIDFEGVIGGGNPLGKGLEIDAGRLMSFRMQDIGTIDTDVTVGAFPLVGAEILIDGVGGRENAWTYNIDPTSIGVIESIPLRIGNPGSPGTLGFSLGYHDSSAAGGNPIGSGAIDMQSVRAGATQVASGAQSILLGGVGNTATSGASAIIGGAGNVTAGIYASIVGSVDATDRGREASQAYASGTPAGTIFGYTQAGRQALYSTGTAAMRLTAGNNLPANYSSIMNIPAGAAYNVYIRLSAIDRTAPANSFIWTVPIALLSRPGAASTTALTLGTPVSLTTGTGSSGSVSATADTTNGGLNLTFTPPSGTDTWDAFADVSSAETQ